MKIEGGKVEVERAAPETTHDPADKETRQAGWRGLAHQLKGRQEWWAVALGYFLLTTLFTYPLIFNFGSALPGQLLEDRDQNLWNLWWVPHALLNFKNPFHTDYIYYPDGVSLYFHTLHPLNGLLSYPVQLLFGLTAAYNFIVFFSFVVTGIGCYLLLRHLCENRAAAFVASLVFVFAPYHIGTLKGLMQLISLEWLPFYLLFLLKATGSSDLIVGERSVARLSSGSTHSGIAIGHLRGNLFTPASHKGKIGGQKPAYATSQKIRLNIGLAAFFLVCTALTDWYYVLFLLFFTALYLVYPANGAQKPYLQALKTRALRVGLIVGLFGLVISPVLLPMLRELAQTSYYLPTENAAQGFSATLAAFFVPPTTSTVLGSLAQNFPAQYLTGPLAAQVYLGYVALALGLLGLIKFRAARFWGLIFGVFGLLAFGPTLQLNGPEPGWPMPFALIQNWPIIKITRSPDRFVVIVMLALAVCATFGINGLMARLKSVRRQNVVAAGLGLLIVLEFLQIPYPLNPMSPNPFFEQLGRDDRDYSILELPAQGGFWTGAPRMANQTWHHKRIFGGYISREYDHPFLVRTLGFAELATLKERPDIFLPRRAGNQLPGDAAWYAAFSYYKVRYLILYLPQNQKQRDTTDVAKNRRFIQQVVPDPRPVYQDQQIEVYELPLLPEAERRPFAQIGEGWYAAEPNAQGGGQHRWAAGPASLNLLWQTPGQAPGQRPTQLNFKLGLLTGERHLRIALDGATVWEGTVNAAQQNLQLQLKLGPGEHRLDFYPEGSAQSPQSLGLGPDPRKLLFYLTDLVVE